MRPPAPLRLLLLALLGSLAKICATRPMLTLFRQPNATELSAAVAAGAPLAWSAHQTEDALIVVSGGQPLALACLLDDANPDDSLQLELSWIVEDEATGAVARHTLAAIGGTGVSKQTFTLDMGPGLQPASGVFHRFSGSMLKLAFPTPPPGRGPLSVACHLRLAGALSVLSARLRLWDERPAESALVATQPGGLACRKIRHRLPSSFAAVTLDCDWPANPSPQSLLLLEAAVFVLYANMIDKKCADDSELPRLQSNSTEPNTFFAMVTPQRGKERQNLRFGWAIEGEGAALQSRLDAASVRGDVDLCVSADAGLPSERRHLRLRWRVRIVAEDGERNRTSIVDLSGDAFAFGFAADNNGNAVAEVSIDRFSDPPLPRALPCPYLCPSTAAASPLCKFAWIHSTGAHLNASDFSVAFRPPDPSHGILPAPHSLLIMPWHLPGNPSPPPQAGTWTCRSQASASSAGVKAAIRSSLTPVVRVTVTALATFCSSQMPRQSVVFLGSAWSSRQFLAINCNVCGMDSSVDAQLAILGSVGANDISVEPTSRQHLPGGGLELGLRFVNFGLRAGSILVRCRAVDGRGRGAVAFSVVEAVPAPTGAVIGADCDGDTRGKCRRFRCPLDPGLAADLRRLPVSVGYLFTLQLQGAAPPQQVMVSSDRLLADARLLRLRCTQLIYYSDSVEGDQTSSTRRQQFLASDPAAAAVHRSVLGDRRYSQLLLAIESGWLVAHALSPAGQPALSDEFKTSFTEMRSSPNEKKDLVNELFGVLVVICLAIALVFGVLFFFIRGRRFRAALAAVNAKTANGSTTAKTTSKSPAADPEITKKKINKKKADDDQSMSGKETAKKNKKGNGASDDDSGEIQATHNAADSALSILVESLGVLPPPQCSAVQKYLLSSAATSAKEFAATTCFTETSTMEAGQFPGTFWVESPIAQSLRMSDSMSSIDGYSAKAKTFTTGMTAVTNLSSCRTAQAVVQDVFSASSRRATTGPTAASDTISAAASIQPSGSPRHTLRIGISQELCIGVIATADLVVDAASSDDLHRPSTNPSVQQPKSVCHVTSELSNADRLASCLTCQPPQFHLATSEFGIEMLPQSSSTSSPMSTPPASPGKPRNADDVAIAEVDVPSSDLQPLRPANHSQLKVAGISTTSEIGKFRADRSDSQQPERQKDFAEDNGSTRTGGWSESTCDDANGALIVESDEEECRRMILDAVQCAMERSLTCD